MKRAIFLAGAFLSMGAVRDLQSIKSDDYQAQPKKIAVTEMPVDLAPEFRDALSAKAAKCGVALAFFPLADADAQMQIRQTGKQMQTSWTAIPVIKMLRYEFTLVDPATSKNVWKSQGDFEVDKPEKDAADEHKAVLERSDDWAEEIIERMRRNKLIEHCGSSVAIAPPQPPAGYVAPAAPVAPMRFKIGQITYNSKEEAEVGLRAAAAEEVSKLEVTPGQPHGGLLVVMAVEKEPAKPAALPNGLSAEMMQQVLAFSTMSSRVNGDAAFDALKKTGLFSPIEIIHADDIDADDFRGQPYKLYVPKETGAKWTLARQGGGANALTTGPYGGATQAILHKWLDAVTAGLNGLGD